VLRRTGSPVSGRQTALAAVLGTGEGAVLAESSAGAVCATSSPSTAVTA
jgi:hypothetical protein